MVLSGCTFHAARVFTSEWERSCPAENRPLLKKLLLTDPLCKRTDELFSDLLTSARILGRGALPACTAWPSPQAAGASCPWRREWRI